MSTISASTTSTTAYVVTADTTGTLVIKTGSTPTTAVTIGSDQSVTFAGTPTYSGGTANGVAYLNGSKALTTGSTLTFDGTTLTTAALAFSSISGGLGKVGNFSRNVNGATGTVSYTGVGFKPSIIIFLATVDTVPTQSIGFTSASTGRCLYIDSTYSTGGGSFNNAIYMNRTIAGNGYLQTAVISSMDSDGFTLSWTQTQVGSGGSGNVIAVSYLAFK